MKPWCSFSELTRRRNENKRLRKAMNHVCHHQGGARCGSLLGSYRPLEVMEELLKKWPIWLPGLFPLLDFKATELFYIPQMWRAIFQGIITGWRGRLTWGKKIFLWNRQTIKELSSTKNNSTTRSSWSQVSSFVLSVFPTDCKRNSTVRQWLVCLCFTTI